MLNHTLLGKEVQNLFLNGEPIGETRLNSMMAAHFGVPVAFVAGDEAVCREAKMVLGDDLPTYAVKKGFDMFCAECLHPDVTQAGHPRRGRGRAAQHLVPQAVPDRAAVHLRARVELDDDRLDLRVLPEDQEAVNPRTTEYTTTDLPEAMGVVFARVHPRAAGRAEGDLQLIDALVTRGSRPARRAPRRCCPFAIS